MLRAVICFRIRIHGRYSGRFHRSMGHETRRAKLHGAHFANGARGTDRTLLRPEGFALQDTLFSNIDPTVLTRAVVRTSFRQGRLVFVVQHQTNKADQREYEMVLTSKGEASVNRAGEPDHWIFNKLQGKSNPAIATDWGPHCFYTQDTEIDNLEMKKIYAADQALRESLRDFENGEQLET